MSIYKHLDVLNLKDLKGVLANKNRIISEDEYIAYKILQVYLLYDSDNTIDSGRFSITRHEVNEVLDILSILVSEYETNEECQLIITPEWHVPK